MAINFTKRPLTDIEFKRIQAAFDEHGLEYGNPPEITERYGFVATDGEKLVGCSSGLAYKTEKGYHKYFYLSDLLVEKEYRKQGLGKKLLGLLEDETRILGISFIWTWTAGYEAEGFYKKRGYEVFTVFENWYPSGHARVGLKKKL